MPFIADGLPGGNPSTEAAMLVLSRRAGEKIIIGKDIVVTVTKIGPKNIRLGIEAPDSVNIVRAELEDDDGEETGPQEGEAA